MQKRGDTFHMDVIMQMNKNIYMHIRVKKKRGGRGGGGGGGEEAVSFLHGSPEMVIDIAAISLSFSYTLRLIN